MHSSLPLCGLFLIVAATYLAVQSAATAEPHVGADLQPFGDRGQLAGAVVLVATHMGIDRERGLITVYLVQHAGFPGIDGGKIQDAFNQAAVAAFGKSR